MTAGERRAEILDILASKRRITAPELAEQFRVSRRTIERDFAVLIRSYPILPVQGHDGGYAVMDGERIYRRALKRDEEELLRSLMPGLQPEQKRIMEHILKTFSNTKDPNIY